MPSFSLLGKKTGKKKLRAAKMAVEKPFMKRIAGSEEWASQDDWGHVEHKLV
jgi:hypothetical protein